MADDPSSNSLEVFDGVISTGSKNELESLLAHIGERQPGSTVSSLAHPPFKLIPRVLDKIRREGSQITLIAPVWGAAWWPQMMGMCRSPPVLLPRAPSLFWGTDKLPRSPPRWETAAFPLCGLTFCSKASRSTPFKPW